MGRSPEMRPGAKRPLLTVLKDLRKAAKIPTSSGCQYRTSDSRFWGLTMIRRVLVLLAVTLVLALQTFPAFADRRIALVIGNSAYQNVARLENPRNDAVLMA